MFETLFQHALECIGESGVWSIFPKLSNRQWRRARNPVRLGPLVGLEALSEVQDQALMGFGSMPNCPEACASGTIRPFTFPAKRCAKASNRLNGALARLSSSP